MEMRFITYERAVARERYSAAFDTALIAASCGVIWDFSAGHAAYVERFSLDHSTDDVDVPTPPARTAFR